MMPTHYGPPQYVPIYMGGHAYMQQQQQQQPHQTEITPLSSNDVELVIRQQPKEALVTIDGKEKARKPVDPPPIIQLKVRSQADPQGHYMQSPYLIMIADLWHPEENEANRDKALSGTICSSLHRLKDVDNKDGAFFVFGDISIKQPGEHRLRFSLFDIHKPGDMYEFVTSIISEKFRVVSQKDFHGMDESTYLSRAFSDQGVRLRLRKEPRHVMGGRKRSPPGQSYDQPQFQPPTPTNPTALAYPTSSAVYHGGYSSHGDGSPAKRQRVEDDSSPRYSASHINSSPSTQLVNRQGNYPVQSPGGINLPMSANWGYGGNYNYARNLAMNTTGAGELSGMAPPLTSSSMSVRAQFSTAQNSGVGLPPVTTRGNNIYGGLDTFGDDALTMGSSHHDRSLDNLPGGSSHIDYSGHTTEGMRGMPVQSPVQSYPSNLQTGSLMAPFEGTGSRASSIRPGTTWPAPVPASHYEERRSDARSHYGLSSMQNPIGGSDGHSSSHHSTSYDDQFKDGYHFKAEGH
ncbi:Velvet factor [Macrophomina phaseolina MS6]|uniref:Velvet factor n=1 Tax=Macrophomina phaseolina (strain MS6) TaxID=1126212 RepID=K2RKV5_MACPH|nr:Velvet factor [Macrophomina phaseolina MS6]